MGNPGHIFREKWSLTICQQVAFSLFGLPLLHYLHVFCYKNLQCDHLSRQPSNRPGTPAHARPPPVWHPRAEVSRPFPPAPFTATLACIKMNKVQLNHCLNSFSLIHFNIFLIKMHVCFIPKTSNTYFHTLSQKMVNGLAVNKNDNSIGYQILPPKRMNYFNILSLCVKQVLTSLPGRCCC
jgi:hypothetical protein